jgi:hypothetical protein
MPFKKSKKPKQTFLVRVTTMDADLEFALEVRILTVTITYNLV